MTATTAPTATDANRRLRWLREDPVGTGGIFLVGVTVLAAGLLDPVTPLVSTVVLVAGFLVVWATLPAPTTVILGHAGLLAVSLAPLAFVVVEVGFLLILLGATGRTPLDPVVTAAGVVVAVGAVLAGFAVFGSLWTVAGVSFVGVALTVYAIDRYERLEQGLIEA